MMVYAIITLAFLGVVVGYMAIRKRQSEEESADPVAMSDIARTIAEIKHAYEVVQSQFITGVIDAEERREIESQLVEACRYLEDKVMEEK